MNLILPIYSIFLLTLLLILFYSKKRIKSEETKLYGILMILSFFNVTFNIIGIYLGYNNGNMNVLYAINHFDLPLYFWWTSILFMYLMYVYLYEINKQKYRILKKMMILINIVATIISIFLKFEVVITEKAGFAIGPCVNFVYALCGIYLFSCIIIAILLIKKNNLKKTIPIFAFIILGVIAALIQKNIPSLIIIPAVIVFVELIMYFTIENPDIKLLKELHKSKEISDNANEEKTLFLYNMTQEIRNTTSEINDSADEILESDSLEENKDSARNIKATTSKFISMTNEILDVSKIDSASIKVYNSKYNIKTIIKQVINVYSDICQNKDLSFRTNIDHNIPETLYGDSIGLKEILTTILNNSAKYTSKGYIELNINTIIKNDICRLIITIEDSGIGIKSEEIDKIKINDKSLSKANKLITLMNGTMLISSNYGLGTKVKIILDQKISKEEPEELTKYDEELKNINILMVDDSDAGVKIIEKLTKGTKIKIDSANNGKECLDKIKTNKYSLILLDEELSQIKGTELIKKIKDIRNFNTKVILLTKDNNYEYNEEYLSFGFTDYILKPVKKESLLEIINKYTKEER